MYSHLFANNDQQQNARQPTDQRAGNFTTQFLHCSGGTVNQTIIPSQRSTVGSEQKVFNVRFAVNGLSKFSPGNQIPSINKNIQAGDYGDDSGMIAENANCVFIGEFMTSDTYKL